MKHWCRHEPVFLAEFAVSDGGWLWCKVCGALKRKARNCRWMIPQVLITPPQAVTNAIVQPLFTAPTSSAAMSRTHSAQEPLGSSPAKADIVVP